MKANELMVGDLVCLPSIMSDDKYPVQVLEIQDDCIKYYSGGKKMMVRFKHVEPIPLTPEILEKNGFEKNKTGQWVIEKKHSIGCCGQTCSNTNPLEYAVCWDEFGLGCVSYLEKEGNITLCGTTYVHQLQQILRLFELDKFIKIEL